MQPTHYCDLICRMRPRARRHRMTIGSVHQVATLILLAGIGIGAPDGSFAAATPGPAAVVTGLVVGVGRLIGDSGLSARDREREFARLLQEDCDLPRVSRYALGAYLAAASAPERQEFSGLFQRWVTRSFVDKIGRIDASQFKVIGTHADGDGTIVSTELDAPGDKPLQIEWRLYEDDNQYRIADVAIEGISMALVEREEMSAVLRRNGGSVARLNHALEQRLASEETSTASATP